MRRWKVLAAMVAAIVAVPVGARLAYADPFGYSAYYGGGVGVGGSCLPVQCLPNPCVTGCPQPLCSGNGCGVPCRMPRCAPCCAVGGGFGIGYSCRPAWNSDPRLCAPGNQYLGGNGFVNPAVDPYGPVVDPLLQDGWDDELNPQPAVAPYRPVDPRDAPYYYGASREGSVANSRGPLRRPGATRSYGATRRYEIGSSGGSFRPAVRPVSGTSRNPFFK